MRVIPRIKIRTKKVLKTRGVEALFAAFVVAGIPVSEVVSLVVSGDALTPPRGGRLVTASGAGVVTEGVDGSLVIEVGGVSLDEIMDWGTVVVGEEVSVEEILVDVFMLGGVGGVGLVGGVGDCISKPPFRLFDLTPYPIIF